MVLDTPCPVCLFFMIRALGGCFCNRNTQLLFCHAHGCVYDPQPRIVARHGPSFLLRAPLTVALPLISPARHFLAVADCWSWPESSKPPPNHGRLLPPVRAAPTRRVCLIAAGGVRQQRVAFPGGPR